MINQILSNGGIDPAWVMAGLAGIVTFFFVRTLVKMDKRMDGLEKQQQLTINVLLQLFTRLATDDDFFEGLSKQLNSK